MSETLNPDPPVTSSKSFERETDYGRGPSAAAPGGWFMCYVSATGPAEDATTYIHLREETGKFNAWYSATISVRKEMLATALSAITSNLKVQVHLSSTDPYSQVNRCYINRW